MVGATLAPRRRNYHRNAVIQGCFGSTGRTGEADWQALRQRPTEDLLDYLALARFKKRPPLMQLPPCLRYDMRAFFGTYANALPAGRRPLVPGR